MTMKQVILLIMLPLMLKLVTSRKWSGMTPQILDVESHGSKEMDGGTSTRLAGTILPGILEADILSMYTNYDLNSNDNHDS